MKNTALMIVDMQKGVCVPNSYHLDETITQIKRLVQTCQKAEISTIYVRHDDGVDCEITKGQDAWQIIDDFTPSENDCIIDKSYNSAFKETNLSQYLSTHEIGTLIICGMQSEYCIDATIKSAFERGYDVIVPKGCTTTVDQDAISAHTLCKFYEETIWNHRYAEVIEVQNLINNM